MARRIRVALEDDLAGGPADETVAFALDGRAYQIDLSANAHALRAVFAPWIAAARAAGTSVIDLRARGSRPSVDTDTALIRAWALAQGIPVSARGRISRELRARYQAEH